MIIDKQIVLKNPKKGKRNPKKRLKNSKKGKKYQKKVKNPKKPSKGWVFSGGFFRVFSGGFFNPNPDFQPPPLF